MDDIDAGASGQRENDDFRGAPIDSADSRELVGSGGLDGNCRERKHDLESLHGSDQTGNRTRGGGAGQSSLGRRRRDWSERTRVAKGHSVRGRRRGALRIVMRTFSFALLIATIAMFSAAKA